MDQNTVSWQAPEFERLERGSSWYLWSMAIALLLIVMALWQKNVLFGLFILLAEIMLLLLGHNGPSMKVYALTGDGLMNEDQMLRSFSDTNGFAFFDLGSRYIELILRPNKKFHTYVKVLVPRERMEDVKRSLEARLQSFEYTPALIDTMGKWLKL